MGRDNQPKDRQRNKLARGEARRAGYDRILIVSEGRKTEPLYFGEICAYYRLPSANVVVRPSEFGTSPLQVVEYAEELLRHGDAHRGIRPLSFDKVYAVFDRDDHESYGKALNRIEALNNAHRNDDRKLVEFHAIASVPSFELWLLLHFDDVLAPLHRDEVMRRLKTRIPGYEKGVGGVFARTRDRMADATQRAARLRQRGFGARTDPEPFTAVDELVYVLTTLGGKPRS